MTEELDDIPPEPTASPSVWQENHGNLLLMVLAGVFLVGASILFYRQNQLQEPRFPDAAAIHQVSGDTSTADLANNEISIVVIGAANGRGSIKLAIYDSMETFDAGGEAFRKESLPIVDGQAKFRVPLSQMPEQFAIATYHDENDDGELNRNRIGIPSERYGFSLNARGVTGPAAYQDAVVDRGDAPELLEIAIR